MNMLFKTHGFIKQAFIKNTIFIGQIQQSILIFDGCYITDKGNDILKITQSPARKQTADL